MKRSPLFPLTLVLLAACGQPATPAEKTFSIRLDPAVLSQRVTETGTVKVLVSRSGGFGGAVAVTLDGEATGLEAAPLTITGAEGLLSIRATDAATLGTTFPTVKAVSGTITRTETLTLKLSGAVAGATTVTVRNNAGSSQVRQGSGTALLEITGRNLDRVSAFKLGDLTLSVQAGRTPTGAVLAVGVPDGTAPGPRTLTLTAPGGDTTVPAALTVTAITSGPAGSDSAGAGTTDRPYRTLHKALSLAKPGDTARLLNGTYSAADGETWPALSGSTLPPNVPAGVTVEGESVGGTVLQGPGKGSTSVGLAFAGDGGAKTLTVRDFVSGLYQTTGAVTAGGLRAEHNGIGLIAGGGTTTVQDSEFRANDTGLIVVSTGALTLSGGSSHDNTGDGLRLGDGAPALTATDFGAYDNATGVTIGGNATASLRRVNLHDNRDHGLLGTAAAQVSVDGGTLSGNGQAGLWFSGKTLAVRGTTVQGNANFGLYVEGSPERVDLGHLGQPGDNDLHGNGPNGTADQILDVRADRAVLGNPDTFTLSATTLNGVTPDADVYPGDGKWPYLNAPYFSVLGKNNVIRVYP